MNLRGLVRAPRAAWIAVEQQAIRSKKFGFLSELFNIGILCIFCGVAGLTFLGQPVYELYPVEKTLRAADKRPLVLMSAEDKQFAKRGDCVAAPVSIDQLPPHLIDALLAMEDRRFYNHFGVDLRGIIRAAVRNYEAGSIRQGGSTITQQLVKISYLSRVKTYNRKAREALLALWLEIRLSKDEILERYLSSAYFGEGCYGVRAAAMRFFNKPVGQLTIPESALLVALLSSPTHLSNSIEAAQKRSRLVLESMVNDGRLDPDKFSTLEPASINTEDQKEKGSYYADWLAEEVRKTLDQPNARQPLHVYTTFEPALQIMAEDAVRSVMDKRGERYKARQAALVAMRTDGRVLAMVGGTNRATSQFNRAVQARRQPGSAFKTFVYLATLRAAGRPNMLIADEPISIDGWEPGNYGGRYRGVVSLERAFASSINTVAVKLSNAVGPRAVIEAARDLGISSYMMPTPSIALGAYEVSLLEITGAYASIAAGAFPVKPWGVAGLAARQADGGQPPLASGLWKLGEADDMRTLLRAVVERGTGRGTRLPIPSFGKTGTSQDYRDAWFIGFAGNLVVGVWVGNDDDSSMRGVTGGKLPAQIWTRFMRKALKDDPKFERTLPRIAAFEERSRMPEPRIADSGALMELEAPIVFRRRESVSYTHDTPRAPYYADGGNYGSYSRSVAQPSPTGQARRPRGSGRGVSQGFQDRLDNMGWPGQ